MKNEKNCKIIQDLLPNYIENLTNEETNIFIEEHLNTCSNCKNILENMQNEIKNAKKIGIMAGASTPQKSIEEVVKYLN